MSPRLAKLTAVVAGVLVLGVPSAIFNYRLVASVERQAAEEIALAARRTIVLVETRIAQALAILDDLAARHINSCTPDHIDALRQATFATTPVKELSIIAPDGRTLCSDLGVTPERRETISSEPVGEGSNALLEVLRFADRPGQAIRIRRVAKNGENGIAAFIPADLLIPEDFLQTATLSGSFAINSRIATRGGTIIREHIMQSKGAGADVLVERLPSMRYAVDATIWLPRSSLSPREYELRMLGALVTGGLALVIFGFLLLMPKRPPNNPIAAIEEGLKAGEFVPYYHPIIDIRTGRLRGAEVLARWRKPDGSVLLPASFIPLAESSGIMLDFTRMLMRQVAKDLGPTLSQRPHLRVSFNVIAPHFANEEIIDDINLIFRHSPLRLSQIVLEMTERQPIENLEETRRVIVALQRMGVQIAIDDVGAGHSGLSYILRLGVDVIKIDKMFVDSLDVDGSSAAIVRTLIDLAQSLRMEIVAEGVETFEQVVQLRNLGIRAAQGHVFAPPLPRSSFIQLIEAIDPLPRTSSAMPATAFQGESLRRSA
ncbi:MAG TPA: EAL domain-containing protein [Xanthobacteraceae bacterium]|nr:EAL domain-containing protein [Xanthobacteraceae bacterium]